MRHHGSSHLYEPTSAHAELALVIRDDSLRSRGNRHRNGVTCDGTTVEVFELAITLTAAKCEDFSVDGTVIRSWASLKSVQSKDESGDPPDSNGWQDFSGEKRSNATHALRTDPEARMMRKGNTGAYLSHWIHFLMEQEAEVMTGVSVGVADGHSERVEALQLLKRQRFGVKVRSLAADKGYDAGDFLLKLERMKIRPAVAVREGTIRVKDEKSATRARMVRRQESQRYRRAQKRRKAIEEIASWMKEIAGLKRVRVVGR